MDSADAEKRRILTLVAEGAMSPADAAEALAGLDRPQPTPTPSAGQTPSTPPNPPGRAPGEATSEGAAGDEDSGAVKRIRIVAMARRVVVTGDRNVREAVAEGEHMAKRDGATLIIDGGPAAFDDENHQHFRFGKKGHVVIGSSKGLSMLQVRVQPDLDLELEVQAGSVTVEGVHGAIEASVAAGSARLLDFRGPIDIDVSAGSLKGVGRLDHGSSRVRCQAGSVSIELDADSDVEITGRAELGRVNLPGNRRDGVAVLGHGTARLDVETSLGSVSVTKR